MSTIDFDKNINNFSIIFIIINNNCFKLLQLIKVI